MFKSLGEKIYLVSFQIYIFPLKVTLYNAKAISGKFAIKACCLCDILGKALGFLGQKLRDVQSRQTAQAVSCL